MNERPTLILGVLLGAALVIVCDRALTNFRIYGRVMKP